MDSHLYLPHWAALGDDSYWYVMLVVMLLAGVAEIFFEARALKLPLGKRWGCHGILFALAILAVEPLPMLSGLVVATWASTQSWGILNRDWLPLTIRVLAGVCILDFSRYAVHYFAHRTPLLWRLHQVHHNDTDLDISTGLRFHPLEVLIVLLAQTAVIACSAMPPLSVVVFGVLTAIQALLAHANIALPVSLDRTLGRFWITPNMHLIHHSEDERDFLANLGVLFPWWDKIFNTFRSQPAAGWDHLRIGIGEQPGNGELNPIRLLVPRRNRPVEPHHPRQSHPQDCQTS